MYIIVFLNERHVKYIVENACTIFCILKSYYKIDGNKILFQLLMTLNTQHNAPSNSCSESAIPMSLFDHKSH